MVFTTVRTSIFHYSAKTFHLYTVATTATTNTTTAAAATTTTVTTNNSGGREVTILSWFH